MKKSLLVVFIVLLVFGGFITAIEFMQRRGWVFKEQMGSGLVFENNDEIITISTRQYSKHYFIWDVPKEVLN